MPAAGTQNDENEAEHLSTYVKLAILRAFFFCKTNFMNIQNPEKRITAQAKIFRIDQMLVCSNKEITKWYNACGRR
jgi:hypothetical protein